MSLPHTAADRAAVRTHHTPTARARFRVPGGSWQELPVRGGRVRTTAGTFPSCTVTLDLAGLDALALPGDYLPPGAPIGPFGSRVRVDVGVNGQSWQVANVLITDVRATGPGRTYTVTAASDEVLAAGMVFAGPTPILDPTGGWSADPLIKVTRPDPILPGDPAYVLIRTHIIGPSRGGDGVVSARQEWYWYNCLPSDQVSVTTTVDALTGGGTFTVTGTQWADPTRTGRQYTVTGFIGGDDGDGHTYTPPLAPDAVGSAWKELRRLVGESMPASSIIVDQAVTDVGLAQNTAWSGPYLGCIQTCLEALGAEMWVDSFRDVHIRPAGAPAAGTGHDVYLYGPNAVVTGVDQAWTRAPNRALVHGFLPTGESARGEAVVGSGPLTAPGYGEEATSRSWPVAATAQALTDVAAVELRKAARRARTVTVALVAHPWIQVGDAVTLHWQESAGSTATETMTVRSVELPVGPGLQRLELVGRDLP